MAHITGLSDADLSGYDETGDRRQPRFRFRNPPSGSPCMNRYNFGATPPTAIPNTEPAQATLFTGLAACCGPGGTTDEETPQRVGKWYPRPSARKRLPGSSAPLCMKHWPCGVSPIMDLKHGSPRAPASMVDRFTPTGLRAHEHRTVIKSVHCSIRATGNRPPTDNGCTKFLSNSRLTGARKPAILTCSIRRTASGDSVIFQDGPDTG